MAFTSLIADRAINWMVDQQILHHCLLIGDRLGAIGINDHAFASWRMTCRHQLWNRLKLTCLRIRLPDFCEADAAVGWHRQSWVIAIMRNLDFVLQRNIDDRLTFFEIKKDAVNSQFWHWKKRTVRGAIS